MKRLCSDVSEQSAVSIDKAGSEVGECVVNIVSLTSLTRGILKATLLDAGAGKAEKKAPVPQYQCASCPGCLSEGTYAPAGTFIVAGASHQVAWAAARLKF